MCSEGTIAHLSVFEVGGVLNTGWETCATVYPLLKGRFIIGAMRIRQLPNDWFYQINALLAAIRQIRFRLFAAEVFLERLSLDALQFNQHQAVEHVTEVGVHVKSEQLAVEL